MALKWFKPDLLSSGNPGSCPLWMDNWTEFVIKLLSTFGPHNPVADTVRGYGNGALHHQFYSGLLDCIKDEICHVGKPHNLDNLCYLAQEIDTCYWECKEEVQCTNKSSGTSNFLANKPGSSTPNSGKSKPTTSS
ncbi:hypothetical protein ID866_12050, partial [Astraeus odoratus]